METNSKIEQIKDVCIYLRKSRGEDEDLEKHREELEELCKENGWRYTIYQEVGSSADIDYRPELQKLLNEIKEDLYDGVVVVDKDRLSREQSGQAFINKTLIDNDCLIITPSRIYDLSNDSDILMSEVEDLMARFEYRMITKRFRRGKKRGAKMGNWVNGVPPFPYLYNQETKGLIVDEENKKWYRYMINKFFDGKPFFEIAWELNKMGIRTQNGSMWHENSIRRLLLSEVHLGKIIYQKTEGSGHKNKKTKPLKDRPKEDWIVVENCHESVKTQEEHDKIFAILSSRRRVPKTSKQIKLPLTGIVKCGLCKKSMQVYRRKKADGTYQLDVKTCQAADPFGKRCGNSSGDAMAILVTISRRASEIVEESQQKLKTKKSNQLEINHFELKRESAITEKQRKKENMERAYLAFENGLSSLEKYKQRKESLTKEIKKLDDEIHSYDVLIANSTAIDEKAKIKKYTELIKAIENYSGVEDEEENKKLNELIKDNIFDVEWIKKGKEKIIDIKVNFI